MQHRDDETNYDDELQSPPYDDAYLEESYVTDDAFHDDTFHDVGGGFNGTLTGGYTGEKGISVEHFSIENI